MTRHAASVALELLYDPPYAMRASQGVWPHTHAGLTAFNPAKGWSSQRKEHVAASAHSQVAKGSSAFMRACNLAKLAFDPLSLLLMALLNFLLHLYMLRIGVGAATGRSRHPVAQLRMHVLVQGCTFGHSLHNSEYAGWRRAILCMHACAGRRSAEDCVLSPPRSLLSQRYREVARADDALLGLSGSQMLESSLVDGTPLIRERVALLLT